MKFFGGPKGRGRGTYTPEALDLFLGGWGKSADLAHYYNLADDMITALRCRVPLTDTGFWTEYLWKSHLDRKNSQAYAVSGGEARLVAEAVTKLKELRNFQSHVWHDNAVLGFSAELADWVEEKYRGRTGRCSGRLLREEKGCGISRWRGGCFSCHFFCRVVR